MAEDKMQTDEAPTTTAPATPEPPKPTVQDSLQAVVAMLEKSVKMKETRSLTGRVLRQTATIRKQLTAEVLHKFLSSTLAQDLESKAFLLSQVPQVWIQ